VHSAPEIGKKLDKLISFCISFFVHFSCEIATLNLHITKNKGPMSKIQIDYNRTISQGYFND
jgi:hypothetical protein